MENRSGTTRSQRYLKHTRMMKNITTPVKPHKSQAAMGVGGGVLCVQVVKPINFIRKSKMLHLSLVLLCFVNYITWPLLGSNGPWVMKAGGGATQLSDK